MASAHGIIFFDMTRIPVHDLLLAPVARPDHDSHHFGEAGSPMIVALQQT